MVHYYMYKKKIKIKKHRQIDKRFVIKFIAKQTNVQTNKQTNKDIRHTENPLQKNPSILSTPPLKKERKKKRQK